MKGVLHIGMPKCMSTSIQTYLREAENVFFAGVGESRLTEPDMLLAVQRMIIRTPSQFYDADYVGEVFKEAEQKAIEAGAEIFALSDETIPFPLGYARADTSYTERLLRLKAVMPQETTVLMMVRRPEDYLKSTYKHRTVMNGMNFSFEEYLKRLILLGDTNLLGTLKYFNFAEVARRIFGSVKVIAMEAVSDDESEFLRLFNAPNAGRIVRGRLPRENSGMADAKFANFRDLHASYGDALSDDDFNVLSPADRIVTRGNRAYFNSVLAGAIAKDQTLGGLRDLAISLADRPSEPCFEMSEETRKQLIDYVTPANALLKEHHGIEIEDYGYDLFGS
ncbi:MAG TPA: hypothetical protein VGM36_11695 [Rhizomicrobium sp.]